MARDQPQGRGDDACMNRIVMHCLQSGLIPDRPAAGAGPAAEVDVLIIKEKILGEAVKVTPAVAAGVEQEPWDLEQVVEMTAEYFRKKKEAKKDGFAEME